MSIITFDYVTIVAILILLVDFLFLRFIVIVVDSLALIMDFFFYEKKILLKSSVLPVQRLFMLSAAASYLSLPTNLGFTKP